MANISKGLLLAGGRGTRLRPMTDITNKHLLPVWNKPMILYPLETLKSLFIKDILIVSGGEHIGGFAEFLGDGADYGVNLTYRVQRDAGGIAEALGLAKDFVNDSPVVVILGDNLFDNKEFFKIIPQEDLDIDKAHIFLKKVEHPERFGVYVPETKRIIEKPKININGAETISKLAVTGLYIYPPSVFDIVPKLKPSARGELEITDINNEFIRRDEMVVHELSGFWGDMGEFDSLLKSAMWVKENI